MNGVQSKGGAEFGACWCDGMMAAYDQTGATLRRMQDFKKLRVWHLANGLALEVINELPESGARRVPGLRCQAVRAATSVTANIAEGCARSTRGEFLHFVEIAIGSVNELEAHLMLARDAAVLGGDVLARLQRSLNLVRRMLISLRRTVQQALAEDEAVRISHGKRR